MEHSEASSFAMSTSTYSDALVLFFEGATAAGGGETLVLAGEPFAGLRLGLRLRGGSTSSRLLACSCASAAAGTGASPDRLRAGLRLRAGSRSAKLLARSCVAVTVDTGAAVPATSQGGKPRPRLVGLRDRPWAVVLDAPGAVLGATSAAVSLVSLEPSPNIEPLRLRRGLRLRWRLGVRDGLLESSARAFGLWLLQRRGLLSAAINGDVGGVTPGVQTCVSDLTMRKQ